MVKRVVLIRHGDGPDDDRVAAYFKAKGITPELRHPFKGEALGVLDGSVAASVVYGGPFNVFETDNHPYLLEEHRWIEACMAKGIPLLGICQGAQSIAHVLGAAVGPKLGEPYEFGFYPVYPTAAGADLFPGELHVAQSHFHGFELPAGAERLAYSEAFSNQAMRCGETTFAFQFHAEVTRAGFKRWQNNPHGAYGKPGAQSREQQDRLAATHDPAQGAWFTAFLDKLFGSAVATAQG
jgi:GMP synthase (glutamine-hydrolysing)